MAANVFRMSPNNPFDGEPIRGRVFTPEEVERRMEYFGRLFGIRSAAAGLDGLSKSSSPGSTPGAGANSQP